MVFYIATNGTYVYASEENNEPSNLYARAACLMDADTGRILYGKNEEQVMPMASTTKIMTLIVALENGNLDDEVEISQKAAKQPKVHLGVKEGEKYKLIDLLYSLMLESHNDSAVAIAEHIGGSVEEFAKLMNQKARDIGCYHTFFITPNGLDAEATVTDKEGNTEKKVHSTTAADLAKILSYCIKESEKKDDFLKITRTSNYNFTDKTGARSFSCNNHNAFLSMMDGAITGKTGFTADAGYCYVGALERDGKSFVVALLACGWPNNKSYKWSDTKKLMNYGINNYVTKMFDEIVIDQTKLEPIMVEDGQADRIGGTAATHLQITDYENQGNEDSEQSTESEKILLRNDETIDVEYDVPDKLVAPIEKGMTVGTVKYKINGQTWKIKNIITEVTVPKINFKWCFDKIFDIFSV